MRINDSASEGIILASGTKEAIDHYYCYYYYQGEDEGIENKRTEQILCIYTINHFSQHQNPSLLT